MGIESVLKAMASVNSQGADAPGEGVALPGGGADPKAVAQFSEQMQAGESVQPLENPASPESHRVEAMPHTLGQRMEAGLPPEISEPEKSHMSQWLDSVTDIIGNEALSHTDLLRVQALAGLAQIEATRNSAVNNSLDNSLKTLIKNG